MSSYTIRILEHAISDITKSCLYYNEKSHGLGFEFEKQVFDLLELIGQNPFLFPIKFSTIREAVLKKFPFVILYEVSAKNILVYAVFHGKQHPTKKKKKK